MVAAPAARALLKSAETASPALPCPALGYFPPTLPTAPPAPCPTTSILRCSAYTMACQSYVYMSSTHVSSNRVLNAQHHACIMPHPP